MEMIAIMDRHNALGAGENQIVKIKEDLRHFLALTRGHIVIYGRKTLASLPTPQGLPHRENWILTRSSLKIPGIRSLSSLSEALQAIQNAEREGKKVLICGGGEVYRQFLPYADVLHLTIVDAVFPEADVFFPEISGAWKLEKEEGPFIAEEPPHYSYTFCTYQKK